MVSASELLLHSGLSCRLIIPGFSIKAGCRHIYRLIGDTDIQQLAFLAEAADVDHGCGAYHPCDTLKVGTLHNLMVGEIVFQSYVYLYFR